MSKVLIDFKDDLLLALLQRAGIEKKSLGEVVNQMLEAGIVDEEYIPNEVDLSKFVQAAVEKVRPIQLEKVFFLNDLFSEEEWESIGVKQRSSFGRQFRKAVEVEAKIATHMGRTSGNKAIYKRTNHKE